MHSDADRALDGAADADVILRCAASEHLVAMTTVPMTTRLQMTYINPWKTV